MLSLICEQVLNCRIFFPDAVLEDLLDEHLRCDIIPDLLIEVCPAHHE